jgi:hypothetical protein
MPTLSEYFFGDLRTLSSHYELPLRSRGAESDVVTVVARCHIDFEANVRFVSYLVPRAAASMAVLSYLVLNPLEVLQRTDSSVQLTVSHPDLDPGGVAAHELCFSGSVLLYVDDYLSEDRRTELEAVASSSTSLIRLQIRDASYAAWRTKSEIPRAFISHDSRDKVGLVRPLADRLRGMLCPVWYDEYSLKIGDSVRESIDKGLLECPKCILVLSPSFLANPGWTMGEFNAAVGRHFTSGRAVLLPIWHDVSREDVERYSPMVADVFALNSAVGVDELGRQLFLALNGA